jgi:hypothetical protein
MAGAGRGVIDAPGRIVLNPAAIGFFTAGTPGTSPGMA